ncbi:gluconokinase [Hyunsoonleella ulvae]|uniref:gluconokinase n=1 Tax=Hyunsoonleella ulvae TaxID=2799948 RepID=UPI001EF08746|nr:gluconokinase [Hyunsoonleella ulvae]
MVIVVMGVSGSGKTTISKQLAKALKLPYYDADDFHPQANIDKMSSNKALNDTDRKPWLLDLAKHIKLWSSNTGAVLACSALKETYRALLSSHYKSIVWVYLSGTKDVIKKRINQRQGHFMSSNLLSTQFDTLEIPDYGIHVDIMASPEQIVKTIISQL